jgi:PKD repeat protein
MRTSTFYQTNQIWRFFLLLSFMYWGHHLKAMNCDTIFLNSYKDCCLTITKYTNNDSNIIYKINPSMNEECVYPQLLGLYPLYLNCDGTTYCQDILLDSLGEGTLFCNDSSLGLVNGILIYAEDCQHPCNIPDGSFTTTINGFTATFDRGIYITTLTDWYDYGDGQSDANGVHTYATSGTYIVCHYVQDLNDSLCTAQFCDTIIIIDPVNPCNIPDGSFTTTINGFTATFDRGIYITTLTDWYDYGDGQSDANGVHTYATSGTYIVCHYVQDLNDSLCTAQFCDTIIIIDPVNPCNIPDGSFTTTINGFTATFDRGIYITTLTDWYDYGDGQSDANGVHTYATSGTYIVCHYVQDLNDSLCTAQFCDTIIIIDPVNPCNIPDGSFTTTINGFTATFDRGIYITTLTDWYDYGDGQSDANGVHTYATSGTYIVCHYVQDLNDSLCTAQFCDTIIIIDPVNPCNLDASFSYFLNASTNTIGIGAQFIANTISRFDYGDGTGYISQTSHQYNSPGTYNLCHKRTSTIDSTCKVILCKQIIVGDSAVNCDSFSCVLPGDADHDLTVNNFDVLAIGLSYGIEGIARNTLSTQYQLQPAANWNTTHYYGYDNKFADCNGNGTISTSDVSVISQNYISKPINIFNHRRNTADSIPEISLSFDSLPTLVMNGNCEGIQISSSINVGNSEQQANNLYGIAFSVEYPESFVDSCLEIQINLDTDSWFQTNDPVILFYKNIPEYHRVDVSAVRTNGQTRSGKGSIGRMNIITEPDIFRITNKMTTPIIHSFNVIQTVAINGIGDKIELKGSTTNANFIVLGVNQPSVNGLSLYPNPTINLVTITANESIEYIRIFNITGSIINEWYPTLHNIQINMSDFNNGMYIFEIKGRNSVSYEKVIKQ